MELFEQIRCDREFGGLSIQRLARWQEVCTRGQSGVGVAVPALRKLPEARPAPKLGEWHDLIDEWLIADADGDAPG